MVAIVLNTLTGAVTEYDGFTFDSITLGHAAGDAGLVELGGDTDAGELVEASLMTGLSQWGSSKKKHVSMVYFALQGAGRGELRIRDDQTQYAYPFPVLPDGESRCQPGRGIRANYLAFGYRNLDGADFQIDRIEALIAESATRRV